jgi:hypothetical protein
MVPDADVYFFPLTNITLDDNREMDAWNNAIEELDSGDVICAAYTPVSSNTGAPNLNFWQDTNVRMELAKNLGICVVVRAGDGVGGLCTDLLTIEPADGDQFAIVASAVSPGEPYKRWADSRNGSNYVAGSQDYTKLNISGWGLGVTTCGKGPNRDNYLGYFTTIYDDPTDANEVNSRSYTQNFGNTAAAAAVAAGTLAQVQGFSKQIFGIGLGPQVARQLLSKGKYEGTARDGTPILTETPTDTEDDRDSSCDTIIANPTVNFDYCPVIAPTGWLTGSFANPRNSMVNVATNPIFDTPNIVDFMVIRGDYIYGNKFSLASQDGQLFGIYGEPTRAHIAYPVPPTVPGDTVSYLSNGDTTDLHVEGNMHNGIPFSGKLQIDIQFQSTQPEVMKLRLFMWDYNRHYWRHVGSETNLPNGTESVSIEVENASRYIEAITNDFHLRVTTLDFAGPTDGPNDQPLPIFYDQITVSDAPVVSPEE